MSITNETNGPTKYVYVICMYEDNQSVAAAKHVVKYYRDHGYEATSPYDGVEYLTTTWVKDSFQIIQKRALTTNTTILHIVNTPDKPIPVRFVGLIERAEEKGIEVRYQYPVARHPIITMIGAPINKGIIDHQAIEFARLGYIVLKPDFDAFMYNWPKANYAKNVEEEIIRTKISMSDFVYVAEPHSLLPDGVKQLIEYCELRNIPVVYYLDYGHTISNK